MRRDCSKPLLFAFAVIGTPLGLIYLFPVPFAAVIILSVYGSFSGALLGPAGSAFGADCLPRYHIPTFDRQLPVGLLVS